MPDPAQPSSQNSSQCLIFRVMRLTRPLPPTTNTPPLVDSNTINQEELTSAPPPWQAEGAPCGVGHLTILPNSFGSIYASESFRSFISVFNQSTDTLRNVSIAVHVQTSSSRHIDLVHPNGANFRPLLSPRGSVNNMVNIALHEQGLHILVCTVTYQPSPSNSSTETVRQFFKFNVLPPVDASISLLPLHRMVHLPTLPSVASRATTLDTSHSQLASYYLVHVRIHNAIPASIFETKAALTVKPSFHVRPLYAGIETSQSADTSGRRTKIGAGDSHNFIFLIFSHNADSRWLHHSQHMLKENGHVGWRNLGEVKISWRSALGEHGTIERQVRERKDSTVLEDVSVNIYAVPHQVKVHRPFVARCAARNNSNQAVRMYLQIRRDLVSEIVPVGVSGVSLGEVAPMETAYCAVTLIGLVRGQHNMCGVRVVDMDSNASYKAEAALITVK